MKLAMVFPGQGSQSVGMLQAYAGLPGVDDVRREAGGRRWARISSKLLAEGPAEQLNQTVNTQPVMLTAGYAAYRAWLRARRAGARGRRRATAWASTPRWWRPARSRFATACRWCAFAPRRCRRRCPKGQGAMAAILGLDDDAVRAACAEAAQGEVVQAVNFNAPGQVVIAGHKAAVARAMEAARRGAPSARCRCR